MNTKTQEALKIAIEAMNSAYSSHGKILPSYPAQDAWLYHGCDAKLFKALQACKEALEQPAQEPVGWMDSEGRFRLDFKTEIVRSIAAVNKEIPLYTHPAPTIELKPTNIAKARDEIYYAWRKYWAWGIPSKDGEAVFNANGDGFLAGWLACEDWINKEKNNE